MAHFGGTNLMHQWLAPARGPVALFGFIKITKEYHKVERAEKMRISGNQLALKLNAHCL